MTPVSIILQWLRACTVGCVLGCMTVWGSSVALCRPIDTPAYLIPYYLRDVRARFQHYATVRRREGGPLYMTVEDFVLAVLASPDKKLAHPSIVDGLKDLFSAFDCNADGYMSFNEFRFLMSLIMSHPDDVALLFRVADDSGDNAITLAQFGDVLRGLTRDEEVVQSLLKSSGRRYGFILKLFGDDENPRRCTVEEVNEVVHTLRSQIWMAEFRQFDTDGSNRITAEEFSELLAKQFLGSHRPFHIVRNIRRLRGTGDTVSLEDWLHFHQLMLHASRFESAVGVCHAAGVSLSRKDFHRALQVCGIPIPHNTADIVFSVFDVDSNDTMDPDEFLYIMKQKMNFQYRTEPREKRSFPAQLRRCVAAGLSEGRAC